MPNQGLSFKRNASPAHRAPARETQVANLAPVGERRKIISLHMLLTNKKRRETRDAARLGDVLIPWFEKTVARPAAKLEGVADLWQAHVPPNILQRCRLVGFQRGTLTVALDSTTVRAELETRLRSGLLRVLQTGSKGALFRVKTFVEGHPVGK